MAAPLRRDGVAGPGWGRVPDRVENRAERRRARAEGGGGRRLAVSFAMGSPLSTAPRVVGSGSLDRAALRLSGLVAAGGAVAGSVAVAPEVVWSSWALGTSVATATGWRGVRWAARSGHRRRWVRPLDRALRPLLGYPANMPADAYLRVPPALADDPDGVRVLLPAGFVGDTEERQKIEHVVASKLGLGGDVNATWHVVSREHYVTFKAPAKVPEKVLFRDDDVRELVERARESKPVFGLAAGGVVVAVDFDSESPHVAISAGTGAGKSAMLRSIAAQEMHHGASLLILDFKRRSHRWARGLEGVTYCREISVIHTALINAAKEAMARNRLADDYPDDQEPPWQRRIILLEEINSTMEELGAYWRDELNGKGTSPAMRALRQILFMGRAVKVHVITASQLFTADTLGGGGRGAAARAQFGTIVMSRFKPASWKMLCPEVTPIPKSGKHTGRGYVVLGGEATETQILYMTEAETRAWAASGESSAIQDITTLQSGAGVADVAEPPHPVHQGESTATVAERPALTLVTDTAEGNDPETLDDVGGGQGDELVTLYQASIDKGAALVGETYDSLRKAAERAQARREQGDVDVSEFPEPVDDIGRGKRRRPRYRVDDLARWALNKERPTTKREGVPV